MFYRGRVKDSDGNEYELYPEVLDILSALSKKKYTLAIASRIEDIAAAYQLLIFFNIAHFFTYIEIYPCEKTVHFNWQVFENLIACNIYNYFLNYYFCLLLII